MSSIAFLDRDPALVARYHVDRLLSREVLDVARILHAAHIVVDGEPTARNRIGAFIAVSRAQMNTPSALWVRETAQNYQWASRLMGQLCLEYELRNGVAHRFASMVNNLARQPMLIKMGELTEFPQGSVPQRFQRPDPIFSHRMCYFWMPRNLAQWAPPAKTPDWWVQLEAVHDMNRQGAEFMS